MSDWPRKRLDLTSRSCCKFFCLHNSGPVPSFHPCAARCLWCRAAGSVLCSSSSSDWSIAPSLGLWLDSWQPGQCKHCHIPVPSSGSRSLHIFLAKISLPLSCTPGSQSLLSTDITRCLRVLMGLTSADGPWCSCHRSSSFSLDPNSASWQPQQPRQPLVVATEVVTSYSLYSTLKYYFTLTTTLKTYSPRPTLLLSSFS